MRTEEPLVGSSERDSPHHPPPRQQILHVPLSVCVSLAGRRGTANQDMKTRPLRSGSKAFGKLVIGGFQSPLVGSMGLFRVF
jgi:hypothetical protein